MLYKQLKRYNNFSVLKGDAEALVEFITIHAFFKTPLHKLKEKKLIECKDIVKELFTKYNCKSFKLPFDNDIKKINLETVHKKKEIDKERLKKLYPEVYKDCLKTVSYNKITIK